MNEPTARVSKTMDALADEVWDALTTPRKLKTFFFGADVESDFRVGSSIRMRGEFKGKPYEDKGEVLAADKARRLSFSHYSPASGAPDTPENYHVVTYELTPEGRQTRVTLTQSNLTGGVRAADIAQRAEFEKTWAAVLDGLSKAVAH